MKKWERPKAVSDSFFGAKLFYFFIESLIVALMLAYDKNVFMIDIINYDFIFPSCFIFSLVLSGYLFLTTGNNPGFYFSSNSELVNLNLNSEKMQSHEIFISSENKQKDEGIETGENQKFQENNAEDQFKYCEKCKIEKLLRMKHCEKCERCVHKFDHHCFWVGGCVGELNHGRFWFFLFSQTITCLLGFIICFDALDYYEYSKIIIKDNKYEKVYSSEYGAFLISALIAFLFFIFTGVLLGYHSYLIGTGQTTWEHNKRDRISYLKDYPKNIYPFSEGFYTNFRNTFCHGNQFRVWKLGSLEGRSASFNYCDNEYYSCC